MGDIKQKRTFEKLFKEAVPNSEGKIWFYHPNKSYSQRKVFFMLDGKEVFVPMYMSEHEIEQWKEHFIEYVATGKFDKNFYCQIYGDNLPYSVTSEIHKFPMTSLGANKFYCHNNEAMKMLQAVRDKYGDAGLKVVPKPARSYETIDLEGMAIELYKKLNEAYEQLKCENSDGHLSEMISDISPFIIKAERNFNFHEKV